MNSRIEEALVYADEYFEVGMVGKSIAGGDHIQVLAAAVREARKALEEIVLYCNDHDLGENVRNIAVRRVAREALDDDPGPKEGA